MQMTLLKCSCTQLEAATINHLHAQLQLLSSAALVPKFTTLKSGMKAQISLETMIEPHNLMHYLRLDPRFKGERQNLTARAPLFTGLHTSGTLNVNAVHCLNLISGRTLVSAYNDISQVFLNISKVTINVVVVLLLLVKTF